MASSKGGKSPVRQCIIRDYWVCLWLVGVLFALLAFSYSLRIRRGRQASAFSSNGAAIVELTKRRAGPSDFNCEQEVGVASKLYIPLEQQYHPVSSNSEDAQHQMICRSKYQQHCYWKSDYTPAASFLFVLRRYEEQHRKCTVGQALTDLALQGSAPSGCQYLVWQDLDGKGNQLISLVSAFVYALLTDRVLLITRRAKLQHLLCEPFPKSSWVLPTDFPEDRLKERAEEQGMFYDRALNHSTMGRSQDVLAVPEHLWAHLSNWQQPADLRFFCEGEQKLVKGIPWVFFHSNQYSVPGMYFVHSFRTKLHAWFPDRAVFLHAGRYLLNPQEQVWARIMRLYRSHMATADRRLGIQVRTWSKEFTLPVISDHIFACAVYTGVLPNVSSSEPGQATPNGIRGTRKYIDGEKISVVLTSLQRDHADRLGDMFAEGDTMGGEIVTVFSPSAEGEQQTGELLHERKVLADMWLLSFADDIISSPRSTFGYVAHGLAGIKPIVFNQYGLDPKNVPNPPCARTNLPGPCFIDHPGDMNCPLDVHPSSIGDVSADWPELRRCELQWGIGVFEPDS